jgi:hypothetical protein
VLIIDAVRDGNAAGIGAEVVVIDTPRRAFPTTPGIFEVAHQFALLAIDTDNGQMAVLEAVAQVGEVFELKVAVGADAGRNLLVIETQGIAHLMEQARHGIGRNGKAECCQFLGDGHGGTA